MKRLLVLLAIISSVLLLGCAQQGLTAEEIAKEMQKRYESVQDVSGEYTTTIIFEDRKESYTAKFWAKKGKFRVEDGRMIMVSNGSVTWIYDKGKNVVTIAKSNTEIPEIDYGQIVEDLLKSYDLKLLGEESIDNKKCYVIDAMPEGNMPKLKLWVDKEYWFPMKMEMDFGNFTSIVEYRNLTFNSGLSDEIFEFSPPKNAKIVERTFELPEKLSIEGAQQRVNFTIIVPTYTAGNEFEYAIVYGDVVQLHYGDLIVTESKSKPVSFENAKKVKIKDRDAEIVDIFGQKILRIEIDGVWITIAGLSEEELVKVAESTLK